MKNIIISLIIFLISGCGVTNNITEEPEENYDLRVEQYPNIQTYNVIIGDSISHNLGYRSKAGCVKYANLYNELPVVNRGRGGWTSYEIRKIWQQEIVERQSSINTVYVYVGFNELNRIYTGREHGDLIEVRKQIQDDYDYYKTSTSCNVVIIEPLPSNRLPAAFNEQLGLLKGDVKLRELLNCEHELYGPYTDDGTHLTNFGVNAVWENISKSI